MAISKEEIEQRKLASNPRESIWLYASAGSGKTKTLIDRIIRLLLSGTMPNKILCLTYTEAAISEIVNRINLELISIALSNCEDLSNKLTELELPNKPSDLDFARSLYEKINCGDSKLNILTLHSFSQMMLKNFPIEAGVKPNFAIANNLEKRSLINKATNLVIERSGRDSAYFEIVSNYYNIYEKFSSDGSENILSLFVDFVGFGNPENKNEEPKFSAKLQKMFLWQIADEANIDEQSATIKFINILNSGIANCETVATIISNIIESGIFASDFVEFKTLILATKGASKSKSDVVNFLENPNQESFGKLITKDNKISSRIIKILQPDSTIKLKTLQEILLLINITKVIIEGYCDNITKLGFYYLVSQNYQELKNKNGLLDFDDLISRTRFLLKNIEYQWILYKLNGLYNHILLDESQDTNPEQWEIVEKLTEDFFSDEDGSESKTLFIVGDRKQSIYNFQGANPNKTEEVAIKFSQHLKPISFKYSFRFTQIIANVVDYLFSSEKFCDAVSNGSGLQGSYQGHVSAKITKQSKENPEDRNGGLVEFWQIFNGDQVTEVANKSPDFSNFLAKHSQNPEDEDRDSEPAEAESEQETALESKKNSKKEGPKIKIASSFAIASKIKKWIDDGRILATTNRQITFSDIMILAPKRSDFNIIYDALRHFDIPVNANEKITLFHNFAVLDLLSALKFILLEDDDLNLAGLLKSAFFNFSDLEIFDLCEQKQHNKTSLFTALSENEKFTRASKMLVKLQQFAKKATIVEVIYYLAGIADFRKNIAKEFGYEALTEFNSFLSIIIPLAEKITNLQELISIIDEQDLKEKKEITSQEAVIINTIHGSKGLEANIIITIFSNDNTSSRGVKVNKTLINQNREFAESYVGDSKTTNIAKAININNNDDNKELYVSLKFLSTGLFLPIYQDLHKQERLRHQEKKRLLYVAMTRACCELYLVPIDEKGKLYQEVNNVLASAEIDNFKYCQSEELVAELIDENASRRNINNNEDLTQQNNQKPKNETGNHLFFNKKYHLDDLSLDDQIPPPVSQKENAKENTPERNLVEENIIMTNDGDDLDCQDSFTKDSLIIGKKFGSVLHKILEIFVKSTIYQPKLLLDIAKNLLEGNYQLPIKAKNKMKEQLVNFTNSTIFPEIFLNPRNKIVAELELASITNGKYQILRIDLLIKKHDEGNNLLELLIIDYKTGIVNENTLEKYRQQLKSYQLALAPIYPNVNIRLALLMLHDSTIYYVDNI